MECLNEDQKENDNPKTDADDKNKKRLGMKPANEKKRKIEILPEEKPV